MTLILNLAFLMKGWLTYPPRKFWPPPLWNVQFPNKMRKQRLFITNFQMCLIKILAHKFISKPIRNYIFKSKYHKTPYQILFTFLKQSKFSTQVRAYCWLYGCFSLKMIFFPPPTGVFIRHFVEISPNGDLILWTTTVNRFLSIRFVTQTHFNRLERTIISTTHMDKYF